jgi:hypothetical protein
MADEAQRSRIVVDVALTDDLRAFLGAEGLLADAAADDVIRIGEAAERRECSVDALWIGGRIPCERARQLAGRLGISVRRMGKLLELLNVKVVQCGLGCF